ncbi:DUF6443 domain-containing protein [Fulvivirga ulvae]|uniref:DUF6443 domain-containing protein n=1 Tax=Fulvivirga ulvae TaxID=2904245 RepID=UPI001F2B8B1D|nr:DUF6443 domain-containing protein [Fulvivirga ulvae]UII33935.1 DUF6443 domain-containing protein [Fulvivirga ulvae]
MMLRFLFSIIIYLVTYSAGVGAINGPTNVNPGVEVMYTYSDEFLQRDPNWEVTNGVITYQGTMMNANDPEGQVAYIVKVKWNNVSSGSIRFKNGFFIRDILSVTIASPLPSTPPNPIASTNACGSKTLTRQGTPPSGVTWYWQVSSSGISTTLGYGSTYVVNNSGTYYLRAKNSTGWSSGSGSVSVTVTNPAVPPEPTVKLECNMATVTLAAPPSGVTYYWQSSASGTSTEAKLSGSSTFLSQSGYYYVRARQGDCWSATRSGYVDLSASSIDISGEQLVSEGSTHTYQYTPEYLLIAPSWSTPGGVASAPELNGSTYTTTVQWSIAGQTTLRLCSHGFPYGEMPVTVLPLPEAPPAPRLQDMYPVGHCGSIVLETFGSPPSGVIWYWQNSPTGTSTSNSDPDFTVPSDGVYYLRGRNAAGGWGPASGGLVVDLPELPEAPPAPTVLHNCGLATISRAVPPSGITYYWQTHPEGTDVSDSRATRPAGSGIHYLRPKSETCWGPSSSITIVGDNPADRVNVALGQRVTYDTDNSGSAGVWWHASEGSTVLSTYSEGTRHYAEVEWGQLGEGYLKGCSGPFMIEKVFVNVVPAAPDVEAGCGSALLTRNGTPKACETWHWYKAGSSSSLGTGATLTVNTSGTYYLRPKKCDGTWHSVGFGTVVNIDPLPIAPTDVSVEDMVNPGFVTMKVNDTNPTYTYHWYRNGIKEHEGTTYKAFCAETSTFKVYSFENGCLSAAPKSVTSNVFLVPAIQVDGSLFLKSGEQTRLFVDNSIFTHYQWAKDGADIAGSTQHQLTVTTPGTYHLAVSLNGTDYYNTASVKVALLGNHPDDSPAPTLRSNAPTATLGSSDINYVRTYSFRVPSNDLGIIGTVPDFPVDEVTVSTQYIDGLGRPVQTVIKQGSPKKNDIVQSVTYDREGRQYREYLPYVNSAGLGAYRNNHLQEQYDFYRNLDNTNPTSPAYKVARTGVPYAETRFEDSPLDKVVEASAPGETWQMGRGHTTRSDVRPYNAADDQVVINWSVANDKLVHQGYVYTGELMVQVTADEHGQEVREFTDKQGRTILKRVNGNNKGEWLDTYYVYDIFGNLRFVLPPVCSEKVVGSFNWATDSGIIDNWAFQYKYDSRDRMVLQKVPGAEALYLVYDNRDRLVLTQDGNQRLNGEWAFTKYDELNRPIIHGVTVQPGSWEEVKNAVKNHPVLFEEPGGEMFGYTNLAFPIDTLAENYNLITYYDNYDFPHADNLAFVPELGHTAPFDRVVGLVTGTVTKVLGEFKWLRSITYYDDEYRVIQTQDENQLGYVNVTTSRYNFAGEVIEEQTSGKDVKVARTMVYDHIGRLLQINHKVEDSIQVYGPVVLVKNEYNEIGELIEKNLHSEDNLASFAQSVDYAYNPRGWLTHINNSELSETETRSPGDYFGMELMYDYGFEQQQYNGNVAGVKWKTFGKPETKAYGYVYDGLNRLRYADYVESQTGAWTFKPGVYNEHVHDYDRNGNILGLTRYADHSGQEEIDRLVYSYGQGAEHANRLLRVADNDLAAYKEEGFRDAEGDDYVYDGNGNTVRDANNHIEKIYYNHLNLAEYILYDDGRSEAYTYDATGTKIAEEIYSSNGSLVERKDFIDQFVYNFGKLEAIQHEEGQVVGNLYFGGLDYLYDIKDHLGNTRLTFTTRDEIYHYQATMETEHSDEEEALFSNLEETRITFAAASNSPDKVARVNQSQPIGPALGLKVKLGDIIHLETYAYYEGGSGYTTPTSLTSIIASVAASYGGVNGGTEYQQTIYNSFEGAFGFFDNGQTSSDNVPSAYLNYILFDEEMNYKNSGYKQLSDAANFNVEKLEISDIQIEETGYIYAYVSHESATDNWVYFDDLKLTHNRSKIIKGEDFYPLGLSFNPYHRDNEHYAGSVNTRGIAHGIKDLGFRKYDAVLGRFYNIDPLADLQPDQSTYQYAGNNFANNEDLLGLLIEDGSYKVRERNKQARTGEDKDKGKKGKRVKRVKVKGRGTHSRVAIYVPKTKKQKRHRKVDGRRKNKKEQDERGEQNENTSEDTDNQQGGSTENTTQADSENSGKRPYESFEALADEAGQEGVFGPARPKRVIGTLLSGSAAGPQIRQPRFVGSSQRKYESSTHKNQNNSIEEVYAQLKTHRGTNTGAGSVALEKHIAGKTGFDYKREVSANLMMFGPDPVGAGNYLMKLWKDLGFYYPKMYVHPDKVVVEGEYIITDDAGNKISTTYTVTFDNSDTERELFDKLTIWAGSADYWGKSAAVTDQWADKIKYHIKDLGNTTPGDEGGLVLYSYIIADVVTAPYVAAPTIYSGKHWRTDEQLAGWERALAILDLVPGEVLVKAGIVAVVVKIGGKVIDVAKLSAVSRRAIAKAIQFGSKVLPAANEQFTLIGKSGATIGVLLKEGADDVLRVANDGWLDDAVDYTVDEIIPVGSGVVIKDGAGKIVEARVYMVKKADETVGFVKANAIKEFDEVVQNVDLNNHIFKGDLNVDINGNIRGVSGVHSNKKLIPDHPVSYKQGDIRIQPGTENPLVKGYYQAKVQVYGKNYTAQGATIETWVKGKKSTFFPDSWSVEKIQSEIAEGLRTKVLDPTFPTPPGSTAYKATMSDGTKLQLIYEGTVLKTAFPNLN